MAIEVNGVTLPDIPEGFFDTYPYGLIYRFDEDSYSLLAAAAPFVYYNKETAGSEYDGYMQGVSAAGYKRASYNTETSTEWEIEEENATGSVGVEMGFNGTDGTIVWSNHNILNNDTGEVYFAGTGDINHILPVIPSDLLVDYPHVAVVKNIGKGNAEGSIAYLLFASKSEIVYIPATVTSNYDALSSMSPGYKAYVYIPGEMTDWFNLNMDSDENRIADLYLGETDEPNEELHLYRSNHNIKTVTSINDDGSYVVSDEVYFAATSFTARFELDYTKFVYGGLDESVVTAPPFNMIDDEYPYSVMIKYASLVYLYTTREPLRAYTSSSNYTYLYYSDDTRSYKLSINSGGMWFDDNTVKEDNDDYIVILNKDDTTIWSNYDILAVDTDKVETGETYFAKSGDISSEDVHELDIRTFPNVPTEWMDVYPYLCAVKLVMSGMTIYAALLSDKNMSAIPIGILDPAMGVVVSNTVSSASYIYVEDTDKWDEYSANINTTRDISCLGHGVLFETIDIKGSIGWSNHNITTYAYDETIDDLVETDDIYFSGSGVVEPPEKMVVSRSFIVAMSGNTRRLTNTLDKMNTDEMTEILSNKQFNLQSKTVTPTTANQIIKPDDSYYGLSQVTVEGVKLQSKTATPTTEEQVIVPDSTYQGLSSVTVEGSSSSAPDCDEWEIATFDGINTYSGSTYAAPVNANGIWVKAGGSSSPGEESGTGLYYSTDGKTWYQSNISEGSFVHVMNANGVWVAACQNGTKGIWYSTDGKTWTQSNLTTCKTFAYGNGLWVAVNTDGRMYRSIDGKIWTACTYSVPIATTNVNYTAGTELRIRNPIYSNGIWLLSYDIDYNYNILSTLSCTGAVAYSVVCHA